MRSVSAVRLEAWGQDDLPVLEAALGDPAMTTHLGGPETPAKIAGRQARYEQAGSGQFKIVDDATGEAAGWVGHWDRSWRDGEVYEIGWAVLPRFQGRGIASAATTQLLEHLRTERKHRFVHAFPSVDNGASNALCRRLGFTLLEELDFEYPPGSVMRCNDWRLDLGGAASARSDASRA
jgi:RimJ/RimL family protein N-acetyltransferase